MPKAKRSTGGRKARRHDPLGIQLGQDAAKKTVQERTQERLKSKRRRAQHEQEEAAGEGLVSGPESRRILNFAREQVEDEKKDQRREQAQRKQAQARAMENDDDDDDDDDDEADDEGHEAAYRDQDDYTVMEVAEEDERALEAFMNKDKPERRTLADIIMEKIKEKEAAAASVAAAAAGGAGGPGGAGAARTKSGLNKTMIDMYGSIGTILSRYRSGRIPKAFKIIPALRNWEEILFYCRPDSWTPQAMLGATRLFASGLNPKMAQRFYALVLLPAVRDDIAQEKKLNYSLYMALKKAMYKPAAFFKGIVLPLCEGGDCTLREAAIIGSVMAKVSVPMMHSAAAMLKIAGMEYCGAASLWLRVLLDKKYSLPHKVIDMLVHHFLKFRSEERRLPVLWHQSLLAFVQRYRGNLKDEQKEAIKPLLRQHFHSSITPEIRRELFHVSARDSSASQYRRAPQQRATPMSR